MKIVSGVLLKIFSREFYRRNAMFFLIVIGLCFGFMSGVEHKALARMFVSDLALLMIPAAVWSLYAYKVLVFNRSTLREPRNAFVHHATLLSLSTQWLLMFPVLAVQFIPTIGYAFFLVLVSLQGNFVVATICIILLVSALLCASVTVLWYDFKNRYHEKTTSSIKRLVDTYFSKPYVQFFLEWISRKDPAILTGTKFLSCSILFGILKLYSTDAYDWRLLGIGTIVTFSGNMPVLFQLHRFENFDFQILRNLPLSLSRRWMNNILSFAVLCLPEFGIVIGNFPPTLNYVELITTVLFALSLMVFLYSSLYASPVDLEKFTRRVFLFSIIEIIAILFNVPMWVLLVINFVCGALLFKKYFYQYEIPAKAKGNTIS